MSTKGSNFLATGRAPYHHLSVMACRGQLIAVRAKGHTDNPVGVTLEGLNFLTACHVPQFHGLIIACGRQPITIRAECHTDDFALVSFHSE